MTGLALQAPSAHGPAAATGLDCVLFLCPAYDCRYPSETMWQRLEALRRIGAVKLLPMFPPQHACLTPPPNTRVEFVGDKQRSRKDLFQYPSRVASRAARLASGRGLIWANSNLFTRRAAFAAARVTGWPVVVDVWDVPDLPMWSQYREGCYVKSLFHRVMSYGLARHLEAADLVVWSLHPGSTRRYFRVDPRRTLFLPNGIRSKELVAKDVVRTSVPNQLLYMGHFRHSRGSRLMVEMMSGLRQPAAELNVVGDIGAPEARKAIAGVPEQVMSSIRFYGHMPWPEAVALVRACGICLYPFPHGPELEYIYPLKLLEYAALNKWIVSSDLAGAQHLLRGYRKVRFCDPGRPAEWMRAVDEIRDIIANRGDEPAEFPAEEYDWQVLGRQLEARVRQLLSRPERRYVAPCG